MGHTCTLCYAAALAIGVLSGPAIGQTSGPWDDYKNDPFADLIPERLGKGPHVLVISDGTGMTKMNYPTGPSCAKARDQVRLQTDSRLTNKNPYVVYGIPKVSAFCVPK